MLREERRDAAFEDIEESCTVLPYGKALREAFVLREEGNK